MFTYNRDVRELSISLFNVRFSWISGASAYVTSLILIISFKVFLASFTKVIAESLGGLISSHWLITIMRFYCGFHIHKFMNTLWIPDGMLISDAVSRSSTLQWSDRALRTNLWLLMHSPPTLIVMSLQGMDRKNIYI